MKIEYKDLDKYIGSTLYCYVYEPNFNPFKKLEKHHKSSLCVISEYEYSPTDPYYKSYYTYPHYKLNFIGKSGKLLSKTEVINENSKFVFYDTLEETNKNYKLSQKKHLELLFELVKDKANTMKIKVDYNIYI